MMKHAICLLPLLAGFSAAAATYNVSTEFSSQTNTQTSLWSYRFNTTGQHDNAYRLMTTSGNIQTELGAFVNHSLGPSSSPTLFAGRFPCWFTPSARQLAPLFCNNGSTNNAIASFRASGTAVVTTRITAAQSLEIVPPPAGLAVVSFLVPTAGMATILYQFTPNDYSCALPGSSVAADGIVWSVDKNAEIATTGKLFSTTAMSLASTGSQNLSFAVNVGDRINFVVAPNQNNPNCDSTVLSASITIS